MRVSQEEILEQIQDDKREFLAYPKELQVALRAQVRILRRSYRADISHEVENVIRV